MQSNPSDDFTSLPLETSIPLQPEEQHHEEQHETSSNENTEAESLRVAAQVSPVVPNAILNVPSPIPAVVGQLQHMVQKPADDRLLTWAAAGLAFAIAVLLLKKFMKPSGHGAMFMGQS